MQKSSRRHRSEMIQRGRQLQTAAADIRHALRNIDPRIVRKRCPGLSALLPVDAEHCPARISA